MNQKGFVIAPVILWIVGALVLTGTVAVKEGLISVDLSEKITHDGSRTGARVGYQSYCNPEQGVVIYENEKMPFVTDEGENVLWTKGDIDCYKERKLAEKNIQVPPPTSTPKPVQQAAPTIDPDPIINCNFPQSGIKKLKRSECSKSFDCQIGGQWYIYTDKSKCSEDQKNYWSKVYSPSTGNSNLPPSEPLVDCKLSYGTFQLRRSTCDDFKKSDGPAPEPLVDCQIVTSYGDFSGKYTQADCNKLKIQASTPSTANTPSQNNLQYTSPSFPTPAPLMIQVEPEPCVVVPPGFGGATSGRVNEAGFPCAN